jgi:ubiquinone/menaquinone biosynthesis C-methylase UbiE
MEEIYQKIWNDEGYNYFIRNYRGQDLHKIEPIERFVTLINKSGINILPTYNAIEIGCGAANNLLWLKNKFGIDVYGTETSERLVQYLNTHIPECNIQYCSSHALPFPKNSFDIVIFRSVLHWVDRDYLLQTIGEAIRITKRYLLISDFCPNFPYSVVYKHNKSVKTFKMDYQSLIESSGIMKMCFSELENIGDPWTQIKNSVYLKLCLEEAFPERKDIS